MAKKTKTILYVANVCDLEIDEISSSWKTLIPQLVKKRLERIQNKWRLIPMGVDDFRTIQ